MVEDGAAVALEGDLFGGQFQRVGDPVLRGWCRVGFLARRSRFELSSWLVGLNLPPLREGMHYGV